MFPWYSAAMLALEANHVMVLRLTKMASGGPESHSEAKLMITEKIDAAVAFEVSHLSAPVTFTRLPSQHFSLGPRIPRGDWSLESKVSKCARSGAPPVISVSALDRWTAF